MHKTFVLLAMILALMSEARADAKFEELFKINDSIWGMDFLPDGRMIFTAREGKMFLFDLNTRVATEVKGLPKVYASGQGGLLDVRLHPEFAKNSYVYFTYAEPQGDLATTALMRAQLVGNELKNAQKLFTGLKANDEDVHFGSRLEFDGAGYLYMTMGERGERDEAQNMTRHQGKVLRFKDDGSVPSDNPFVGKKDARPEIWSLGHRSPQGLVRHPISEDLWEVEMGPRGGDEVNLLKRGANYGWPVITYGKEYWGPGIGEKKKAGMEQPVVYWVPSISPSGATFYTGDKYPQWKHHLFLATLSGEHVRRLEIKDNKVIKQETLLSKLEYRWRSLRTGPDGYLYLGSDEGRIGRLLAH
jgi:glucose/arabinose dehydrogenase